MSRYDHLTHDELVRLLEARDRRDATRFGLVWEANEIERDKAINADFVALDWDAEQSTPPPEDGWRNLIIEGDNFDALRYLRITHAGKVKCIYIDPPYNTGNRDFVYNDRFVDKNDSWRHSTWCEFMYQRLLLAKDLLTQDGVIFVSIDDNEVFALGMLMNKVFGEANFVANVIWQKRYSAANDHKTIAPMHEYVVVYRASEMWERNLLPRGEDKDKQYRFEDEGGVYRCSDYTCNKSAEERPNLFYPIIQPVTGEEIWPKRTRVWAYSNEEHLRHVAEGLIYWGKDGKGKVPSFKRYKHMLKNDGVVPNTWWTFNDVGHNDTAKKELLSLLPDDARAFSTPKPSTLIKRVLQVACGPDDIILDFFAGSGTTAHAVLKLNAEDGGNRRFILVSNTEATEAEPDKNLCRDVCAKRVRRVIEGYGDAPALGGDFAYLRCRRIPAGQLLEIEHEQVWTALQMIHRETLRPLEGSVGTPARIETNGGKAAKDAEAEKSLRAPFLQTGDDQSLLIYVPRFTKTMAPELRAAVKGCAAAVIYSWQPETLRQHIRAGNVQHEAIPESLARRFGMKS